MTFRCVILNTVIDWHEGDILVKVKVRCIKTCRQPVGVMYTKAGRVSGIRYRQAVGRRGV